MAAIPGRRWLKGMEVVEGSICKHADLPRTRIAFACARAIRTACISRTIVAFTASTGPRTSGCASARSMPKRVGDVGFPLVVHPRDHNAAWVLPMNGTTVWPRTSPEGKPAVYATRNAGKTWQRQDAGLPASQAWWTVKRQAMTGDAQDPVGLYFAPTSGELWMSRDEGSKWRCIARNLPEIYAVEDRRDLTAGRHEGVDTGSVALLYREQRGRASGATACRRADRSRPPLQRDSLPHGRRAGTASAAHPHLRQRRQVRELSQPLAATTRW